MIEKLLSIGLAVVGIVVSLIISKIISNKTKRITKAVEDGQSEYVKELEADVERLQNAKKFLEILVEVPEVVNQVEQILYQPGSGKGKNLLATTQLRERAIASGLELDESQKQKISEQIESVLEAPHKKEG